MVTHELCNHSDHLLYFWVQSPRVHILSFILRVSLRLYMAIHEFINHTEHLLQFWALSPRVHVIFSFSHSYLSFSMAFFDSPGSGSILALCMIVSKKNPGGRNFQKFLEISACVSVAIGMRGGGLGSSTIFKNSMSPTPRRKWYLTTGRRAH